MAAREKALLAEMTKIQAEIEELENMPAVKEKTDEELQMFRYEW